MAILHRVHAHHVEIPLLITEAKTDTKAVFLLFPALGVRAKFYTKLADGLSACGITTVIVEQRGNGESPYRPGDGSVFGLRDYLDTEINAATQWVQSNFPGMPIYIAGHSLGGHMATLAGVLNPDRYSGIVRLACGFPYYKDFPQPSSAFIQAMIVCLPIMTRLLGYFPGNRLGFGGREYRDLMMDWRLWAKSGRYENHLFPGSEVAVAAYTKNVISIEFDQDTLAPDAALDRSTGQFKAATITRLKLGREEQGEYLGHINWGRRPDGVVAALVDWLGSVDG